MSKNSDKIFHEGKHTLTSKFGEIRKNNRIHQGTDYGTFGINIVQFCPRDYAKVVKVVNKELAGNERGLYVEVQWKSIDRGLILQHLEKVYVTLGELLMSNSKVGTTGMTGKNKSGNRVSTGIHAHIELYEISTGKRLDFDKWNMEEDMTREEIAEMIDNALSVKDATPSDWAKFEWGWGIENELTDGTSPKGYLQRQEAMILLNRFYKMISKLMSKMIKTT